MANNKLTLEIIKYSARYEDELKRSGLNEDQTKAVLAKFVDDVLKTYSSNSESAIRAFSFHNSLNSSRNETPMVKKLSIYRHK